jgi:hypothetical protein
VLTGLMAIFALSNATAAKPEKITICHATGSESNPYVANTVSFSSGDYEAALEKSGHFDGDGETEIGHEDDFILPFHGTKEDCVASPSPSPTGV